MLRGGRDGKTAPKAAAQLDSDSFNDLFYVGGGADAWEVHSAPLPPARTI